MTTQCNSGEVGVGRGLTLLERQLEVPVEIPFDQTALPGARCAIKYLGCFDLVFFFL